MPSLRLKWVTSPSVRIRVFKEPLRRVVLDHRFDHFVVDSVLGDLGLDGPVAGSHGALEPSFFGTGFLWVFLLVVNTVLEYDVLGVPVVRSDVYLEDVVTLVLVVAVGLKSSVL